MRNKGYYAIQNHSMPFFIEVGSVESQYATYY